MSETIEVSHVNTAYPPVAFVNPREYHEALGMMEAGTEPLPLFAGVLNDEQVASLKERWDKFWYGPQD